MAKYIYRVTKTSIAVNVDLRDFQFVKGLSRAEKHHFSFPDVEQRRAVQVLNIQNALLKN